MLAHLGTAIFIEDPRIGTEFSDRLAGDLGDAVRRDVERHDQRQIAIGRWESRGRVVRRRRIIGQRVHVYVRDIGGQGDIEDRFKTRIDPAEDGDLVLAKASPEKYEELARATVLMNRPCRAPIALADGRLYGRDGRKLVCWDLKK